MSENHTYIICDGRGWSLDELFLSYEDAEKRVMELYAEDEFGENDKVHIAHVVGTYEYDNVPRCKRVL